MLKNTPIKQVKKSDCDVLFNNAEDSLVKLGKCFDNAFDERKTKMNVVGSIFGFGASLTKLAFNVTGCAIKNAPKAVVAVAALKREVIGEIESGVKQYQKEQQEEALNEKIKQLTLKR